MVIFFAEIEIETKPFKVILLVFHENVGIFHALRKDVGDVFGNVFHKISIKLLSIKLSKIAG